MSEEKANNTVEYKLRSGEVLKLDLSKNTGYLLMKCRNASNGSATVIYMISEIGTFDGVKIPAPELLERSSFEIIELESIWSELAEKK